MRQTTNEVGESAAWPIVQQMIYAGAVLGRLRFSGLLRAP